MKTRKEHKEEISSDLALKLRQLEEEKSMLQEECNRKLDQIEERIEKVRLESEALKKLE